MKLVVLAILALSATAVTSEAFARSPGGGSHGVRGYTTKHGTYVAPHRQTNPNSYLRDNWSTKGNVNPYTGKPGTR
jgi:hypothetical protein